MKKVFYAIALALVVGMLFGCGGGGGSGGTSADPATLIAAVTGKSAAAGSDTALVAVDDRPADVIKQPAPAVNPCSVAYWGDSISGQTAPHIDKHLQVSLHAVAGGTSMSALSTFLQDPLEEQFIVIEYGMNDSNFKMGVETTFRSMLEYVKSKGRIPVLTGISQATTGEVMYYAVNNLVISNLAKEYGALYADWPNVRREAGDLMADGVHPTEVYQQRLADAIGNAIFPKAQACFAKR